MAGDRLIEEHLARLCHDLPARIVEELADGLTETWERHLAAGLPPEPAARAAIAEFGSVEQITGAFVTESPGRRTARLLLITGPVVGACWGAGLATGRAWTWQVPAVAAVLLPVTLLAVVVLLVAAATARRSYRRTHLGAYGGLGLIALDLTTAATVLAVAPGIGGLTVVAVGASLARIGVTARCLSGAVRPPVPDQ